MEATAPERVKDPVKVQSGKNSQAPEILALRIAKKWPTLNHDQQAVIRAALGPVLRDRGTNG